MAKIIAFMGASDTKVWISPAHVTRVIDNGEGLVTIYFVGGQPAQTMQVKGVADEVVAKLNSASD